MSEESASVGLSSGNLQDSPEGAEVQFRESPIPGFLWRRERDDFVLIEANGAAERFTQNKIRRLIGTTAKAMYPDLPEVPASLARCLEEGTSHNEQLTYRMRSTDEIKELAVTYVPIPPGLVLVYVNDLTESRQVEARLRESENRFRAMVEMTPVPFLIARVSDGQIRYMNPILREVIGEGADDLLGKSTASFYANPADRERIMRRFMGEGSLRNVELRLLRPNGRPVWVSVSANLIRYEGEDCTLSTMVDLTEQKLIEEALATLAITTGGSGECSLLQTLVDQLVQTLGVRCALVAGRGHGGELEVRAAGGPVPREELPRTLKGALWTDVQRPVSLYESDVGARFAKDPLVALLKAESAGICPLQDRQGRRIGLLAVIDDQPLLRGGGVERILGVFAVRVAAELLRERVEKDLSRAEEKIKEYAARQRRLAHQLLRTQENERRRIAHELHDEIGQGLTAVHLNLAAVLRQSSSPETSRRLQESMDIIDRVLEQAHDLSLELRPSMLDDLGLAAALRWYADRLARRAELELRSSIEDVGRGFDPAIETACFRVAQEALTNVARHGRATTITVILRHEPGQLELEIHDDGVGFDPAPRAQRAGGQSRLGLLGMEERVSLVGGELEIQSQLGVGTRVRARFPLNR